MDDRKYSSSQHERFSRLGSEAAPARAAGAWTCFWVFAGVDKSLHQPAASHSGAKATASRDPT